LPIDNFLNCLSAFTIPRARKAGFWTFENGPMSATEAYECRECHRREQAEARRVSGCCGQPMAAIDLLPVCDVSQTAEHSRLEDDGEPCNDGRGGLR
jgi:hypothetical protein